MVETGLQEFWEVVMFCGADESGYVGAGQGAWPRVEVVQQDLECVCLEFDDCELEKRLQYILSEQNHL